MAEQDWIQKLTIKTRANVPIATQIAEQIRWYIAADIIHTDEKLPSIRKLADVLSINLHTVRSAYNKLESRGLIKTVQSLGSVVLEYNPFHHAERFSDISTNTVGILVPDIKNPFYTEFLMGVDEVAKKERIITTVYNTQGSINSRISDRMNLIYKNMLLAQGIEGLLVGPFEFKDDESPENVEEYFNKLPIPVVFVDRPEVSENVVNLDAFNAGILATEHLFEHGHKTIGIITGKTGVPTLNNCYQGYIRTLEKHGLPINEELIMEVEDFSFVTGYKTCSEMVCRRSDVTALFIAGDTLSVGALRALADAGIRVPGDIAIIGYNNIELAAFTTPSLTTVATPIQELGSRSIGMLISIMNGEKPDQNNILLPTNLIIRQSCGCTA